VTHIKAYRKIPNARLAAVCDSVRLPEDGDLSYVVGNVGTDDVVKLDMAQLKATRNIEDLLTDPAIDVIDLCVPTLAHTKLAVAALQAGKHVICEKPMARNSALAREIVEAAQTAKGYFLPAMCIRFWPEYYWVKQAIAAGKFGRVLAARFTRIAEPPAWGREHFFDGAKSGGALLDLHIHDTDFVQFCFGRPKSVFSSGFSLYSGAIDHVVTQYQVECGAAVIAEGTWAVADGYGFNMSYTVMFENATVDYNLARKTKRLRLFRKGKKPRTVKPEGIDGYVGELSHMIDSIEAGKPPTIVTAQDGLSSVEICEAEEKSIATKSIVSL
jgi:predicted dehydrogenase